MTLDTVTPPMTVRIAPYIGVPWAIGGRDHNGTDCYGLVYLFYKGQLKINLPMLSIYGHLEDPIITDLLQSQESHWTVVDPWSPGTKPADKCGPTHLDYWQGCKNFKVGDVLLYRVRTRKATYPHVGIYTGTGMMLHQLEGALSCWIDIDSDLTWNILPKRPYRMSASGREVSSHGRFVNAYRYTYLSR